MEGGGGGSKRGGSWEIPPLALPALAVGLSGAIVAASYLKQDLTRNDFERFDDLRLSFLFFALFLGLGAVHLGLYLRRPRFSPRLVGAATIVLVLLLFASFPVGSRDVFGYAFFGRMLRFYGADPFLVSPSEFAGDAWLSYTTRLMTHPVSAYGPVFLAQAWLVDALAGQSMWVSVWLHKALCVLMLLATIVLSRALLERTAPAKVWTLLPLLAWNPLLLFEAAGAAHNDIAMVVALLAALWCRNAKRPGLALALLVVSFWYKWYSAIFLPPFLIDEARASGVRSALRQGVVVAVASAAAGFVLFAPFPGAFGHVLGAVANPEKLKGIFPTELSPPLALLFWGMRAAGAFDADYGFRLFDLIRIGLFLAAVVLAWLRQWRAAAGLAALVESCFLTGLAFFMLMITQLWPWHLLALIALGITRGQEPFVLAAVLLTLAGLLSYSLTFAWSALMMAAIVVSIGAMRRFRPSPA